VASGALRVNQAGRVFGANDKQEVRVQALLMILETVAFFLIGAALLRTWLAWVGLSLVVQPGRFVVALTDWLVNPLRRVLPASMGRGRLDSVSLMAAVVLALAYAGLWYAALLQAGVITGGAGWVLSIPVLAARMILKVLLQGVFYLVLGYAVLSWVQPQNGVMYTLARLLEPLLGPIRRWIPLLGGVDLSPVALMVATQVLQMLLL
jgi:YggT family protein